MTKLRLALHKGEELRFLSHLDFAHAAERMIRRAGIKAAYSEGFNPHMKISFSSALALGITATAEYMDVELAEDCPIEEAVSRLNAVAPVGLEVLEGRVVLPGGRKMMAACNYAEYEVVGNAPIDTEWAATLASFNELTEIPYEKVTPKKTKIIDIKHFLRGPIRAEQRNNKVHLFMAIGIYPEGSVKASEIWGLGRDAFHWPIGDDYTIHRSCIMIEENGKLMSPMDM